MHGFVVRDAPRDAVRIGGNLAFREGGGQHGRESRVVREVDAFQNRNGGEVVLELAVDLGKDQASQSPLYGGIDVEECVDGREEGSSPGGFLGTQEREQGCHEQSVFDPGTRGGSESDSGAELGAEEQPLQTEARVERPR